MEFWENNGQVKRPLITKKKKRNKINKKQVKCKYTINLVLEVLGVGYDTMILLVDFQHISFHRYSHISAKHLHIYCSLKNRTIV